MWNHKALSNFLCSLLLAIEFVATAVCLTFLLTLVLGVSIGVLSVLGYQRCRKSGQSSQTGTEMMTPTAVVYEKPVVIKPDPHTQGNVAYGHVHFT